MNKDLKKIYNQDKEDRKNWEKFEKNNTLKLVDQRDKERIKSVLKIIKDKNNGLEERLDYYHAAMVLQHSKKPEHYKLAHELCSEAIKLGLEKAKWLYAASLDRYLINSGNKFQKYGTQYKKEKDEPWYLCPVDPTTTDEMRAKYNVPTLRELKEQVKEYNKNI